MSSSVCIFVTHKANKGQNTVLESDLSIDIMKFAYAQFIIKSKVSHNKLMINNIYNM